MPTIAANGLTIAYELRGPASAPVMVFANALGATKEMWREQAAAFAGRYRCLTYDANGHGATTLRKAPARIESYADDLAALLDALGIKRAHVVGASLGGMTAQVFAARNPDRIDRLVLISTTAKMPDPSPWQARAAQARADGLESFVDSIITPRWFSQRFAEEHPDRTEEIRRLFLATKVEGYAAGAIAVGDMDLREIITGIKAPTLIVVGADDPATPPAMALELKSRIQDSRLIMIPNAAHMVAIEQAAEVSAFLGAFLDAGRGAGAPAGPPSFADGLANRRAVLGDTYVDRALEMSGEFGAPWQDFVSRVAWGEAWGDPSLSWKTRSLLTLALCAALNREDEFRLHLKGALLNGATREELQGLIRHVAVYAGAPAGNNANRWALSELRDGGPDS